MILCAGRASANASRMCSKMMAVEGREGTGKIISIGAKYPLDVWPAPISWAMRSISRTYIHFFPDLGESGVVFEQFRKPE